MANRNPGLSKNTERVLTWAAQAQERDDTVRELWKALCDRFDVSTTATGEEVLRLLRKAGSPDVVDIFRDEPAPYPEVCWHTAEKLRPMFDDTECTEEDILVCEKYVLKRMGIAAEVENQVAKLVLAEILIAVDNALAELTLIGITVPAYRKAIPGVIYVALLRKLHAAESAFRASPANKPMKRTPDDPSYSNSALPS